MMIQLEKNCWLPLQLPNEEMSDDEFFHFCVSNKNLRLERDEQRQIFLKLPQSPLNSIRHVKLMSAVEDWNRITKQGKTFGSNLGYSLPDGSMRCASASWIVVEKWNKLSKKEKERFAPFAPDFLVEVMSPCDEVKIMQEKMHTWMDSGVRLGWLISPEHGLTFIYRANGAVNKVEGFDKKLSGEDVLPGFEFDLSVLL